MQLGWLWEEFRQKVSYISRPMSSYFLHLHLGKEHDLALSTTPSLVHPRPLYSIDFTPIARRHIWVPHPVLGSTTVSRVLSSSSVIHPVFRLCLHGHQRPSRPP